MNEIQSNKTSFAHNHDIQNKGILTCNSSIFTHNLEMLGQKAVPLKVILLGSSGVGKTSIINKYVKNVFQDNLKPTIGIDFANKPITTTELKSRSTSCDGQSKLTNPFEDAAITLQIWDTMG